MTDPRSGPTRWGRSTPVRWSLLMSVMVGTIAAVMSSTIVNVAIADLSRHFTLGQDRAQWVTSGFMAAMTASMLTTPWLLSRFGYRAVYCGCMWLLLAGSFGLMTTMDMGTALVWMMAWSVLGRNGMGFVLPSLNLGAMRGMPADTISPGSSTVSFVRMLGGAAGVSLCGVALQWRLSVYGVSLNDGTQSANRLAAFDDVFLFLAGLCAVAMLAAWRLRPAP